MSWVSRLFRWMHARESGQAMVLFAGGAVVTLGSVGLAVDAGRIVGTRAEMQKAADAAALAGSQDLPNASVAITNAHDYLHKNAGWSTEHDFHVRSDKGVNDTIIVVARKRVDYTFLRVLGMSGTTVSAKASVNRGFYSGGTGILPWGLLATNDPTSTLLQNECFVQTDSRGVPLFRQDRDCTLKFGAGTSSGGDFGALVLDATGAQSYEDAIVNGSRKAIRVNDLLDPQTGNMIGPTRQAVQDRLSRPAPPGCPGNDINQTLNQNASGTWTVEPGCALSARIIVIPVIDKIDNPNKSKVLGFAIMYLKSQSTVGGHFTITGRFLTLVSPLIGGEYNNPNATGSSAASLTDSCRVCAVP